MSVVSLEMRGVTPGRRSGNAKGKCISGPFFPSRTAESKTSAFEITELLSIADQNHSAESDTQLLARTLKTGWGRISHKSKLKELSSRQCNFGVVSPGAFLKQTSDETGRGVYVSSVCSVFFFYKAGQTRFECLARLLIVTNKTNTQDAVNNSNCVHFCNFVVAGFGRKHSSRHPVREKVYLHSAISGI